MQTPPNGAYFSTALVQDFGSAHKTAVEETKDRKMKGRVKWIGLWNFYVDKRKNIYQFPVINLLTALLQS